MAKKIRMLQIVLVAVLMGALTLFVGCDIHEIEREFSTVTVEKTVQTTTEVTVEKPVEKVVEKVADPTPTPITPTDTGSADERLAAETERQRKKRGYAATRVADDRSVRTDAAQTTGRQTLGG